MEVKVGAQIWKSLLCRDTEAVISLAGGTQEWVMEEDMGKETSEGQAGQ